MATLYHLLKCDSYGFGKRLFVLSFLLFFHFLFSNAMRVSGLCVRCQCVLCVNHNCLFQCFAIVLPNKSVEIETFSCKNHFIFTLKFPFSSY